MLGEGVQALMQDDLAADWVMVQDQGARITGERLTRGLHGCGQ
jgi:hypothetical protein